MDMSKYRLEHKTPTNRSLYYRQKYYVALYGCVVVRAFGHVSTQLFRVHDTSISPTAVVTVHVYLSIVVHVCLATAAAAASIFAHDMS